ncbi:hypothetical protein ACJX0J_040063, partial [Zea mays]
SPTPNCPVLPPSMAKVHDVVAMTKQLQNSNLEGASSSNAANVVSQVGRDLPPVPSFKATNIDSSFSKFSHMERYWRTPYPSRPIPRAPEGTSSSTPVAASTAVPASEANLTAYTSTFLSQRADTPSLPPKGDPPPSEDDDLELTVAPPSQQNMTNMSSQNA